MADKKIKVRILQNGQVEVETQGIKGRGCTEYIAVLEELLKAETIDSHYTPEYYETEEINTYQNRTQDLRGNG